VTAGTVKLGSVLSVVAGLWALGTVALPFGVVAGSATALFGLAFGVSPSLPTRWALAQGCVRRHCNEHPHASLRRRPACLFRARGV